MRAEGICIKPKTWAYLITIATVVYYIRKICANRFPQSRYEALTDYYLTLINTNFFLLINYLHEFHKKKLEKHIHVFNQTIEKNIDKQKDELDIEGLFTNSEKSEDDTPSLNGLILDKIIFNSAFIIQSVRQQPIVFLEFVHDIENAAIQGSQGLVESYYRRLISEKNACLTEGLNQTVNFVSTGEFKNIAYQLTDSRVSQLTVGNLAFTCRMKILRTFGEEGLKDADTNKFFDKEVNEWSDAQYYVTPARICLKFYDIFIRELISHWYKPPKDSAEFIYLYYLYLISKSVYTNFHGDLSHSYAKKLFYDILSNMRDWIFCMEECNHPQHLCEILLIINHIITLDGHPDELRAEAAKWLLETLLDLSNKKNIKGDFVNDFLQEIKNVKKKDRNGYMLIGWEGIDHIKYDCIPLHHELDLLIN